MNIRPLAFASVALMIVCSIAWSNEPVVKRPIYDVLTDEDEVRIGQNAAAEIETKMPILHDKILNYYVESVGKKIASASRRPNLQYHFYIVNTQVINAFSVPGGFVYVNRGMLDFVQSESELAGVLAHEVGHIVAYHAANDISRRLLLAKLAEQGRMLNIPNDAKAIELLEKIGGPVALFAGRKFSRDQEIEADRLGVYNTARGAWNPESMATTFERLEKFSGSPSLIQVLLDTHPRPADRVVIVREEISHLPPAKYVDDTIAFKAAKARMKLLPAPRAVNR